MLLLSMAVVKKRITKEDLLAFHLTMNTILFAVHH